MTTERNYEVSGYDIEIAKDIKASILKCRNGWDVLFYAPNSEHAHAKAATVEEAKAAVETLYQKYLRDKEENTVDGWTGQSTHYTREQDEFDMHVDKEGDHWKARVYVGECFWERCYSTAEKARFACVTYAVWAPELDKTIKKIVGE